MSSTPQLALHHVGIACHSIVEGIGFYQKLGFMPVTSVYTDPTQKVRVQFLDVGADVLVELVEPIDQGSTVSNFLAKRGPGLHHLCYEVDGIERLCVEIRESGGIVTCPPTPAVAFQRRRIAFVYASGSLVEFLEREVHNGE